MARRAAKKTPRLTVFLGAGGVGKTTLSAAYALGLAMEGRRVALLSIDPAKRMQSAIGLSTLDDNGVDVKLPAGGRGRLTAFQLSVPVLLRRWVREQGLGPSHEKKLLEHSFFTVISEKLASATDAFAAARLAEIRESIPDLDEVVVDTAPGIHAIDFIVRPERLIDFMDSRVIGWIRSTAGREGGGLVSGVMRLGAKKVLSGLSLLGGEGFLAALGEFLFLLEGVLARLGDRLSLAHEWLRSDSASVHVVASLREDALHAAETFHETLSQLRITPRSVVLNRVVPAELQSDVGFVTFLRETRDQEQRDVERAGTCPSARQEAIRMFSAYFLELCARQVAARERLGALFPVVGQVPILSNLDSDREVRVGDLARLGATVRSEIQARGR
jgi:arsenite-transporting ATPase